MLKNPCAMRNEDLKPRRYDVFNFKPFKFVKCHPCRGVGSNQQQEPKPRSGHRVVCNNVDLYCYGGYNPNIPLDDPDMQSNDDWGSYRPLFREVWKLNFASRIWTKLNCAGVPDVLASNAVILAGNMLMVFGGTGVPFGAHCSNELFICDLSKQDNFSFTFVPTTGAVPTPKYGQAIMVKDEFLYTVGGTTGYEYSSDIHRLDLRTKIWEQVYENNGSFNEPPGRYRHELAFDGGVRILLLGGGTADSAYGFEVIAILYVLISRVNNRYLCIMRNKDLKPHRYDVFNFKPFEFVKCQPFRGVKRNQQQEPKPRSGHRVVCNSVNLYCYGGYNRHIPLNEPGMQSNDDWGSHRPPFREVWKLNFASRIWTKLNCAGVPDVLASNAVILAGNMLMVFGGSGVPFGAHCSNELFICDLSKQDNFSFTFVPTSGPVLIPKYVQSIMVKDEYLYTLGSTSGYECSFHIHRLDLKTKIWEEVDEIAGSQPEEYYHELASDSEAKILLYGGGTPDSAFTFKEIERYNLGTNRWERVHTVKDPSHGYPSDRRCHSCVPFRETDGRYVYIIGGYNKNIISKDVWRLDLTSLQWTKLRNSYPMPIYFHSSAITSAGKVYTFGGIVKDDPLFSVTTRTNDIYTMWVTIPKLKEICWEALLYFNPSLHMLPQSELLNSGIPLDFIKRIDLNS